MLSVVITAYREPETVGRAVESFLGQLPEDAEIIVVCPDPETTAIADAYAAEHGAVRHVRDPQLGKPTALNIGARAAEGEILVFSDGDVHIADGGLAPLLSPFGDPAVGATTGRPVSTSPRDTMMGYWSHLLTEAGAHEMRLARDQAGGFLVCSGYLFAVRSDLFEDVPADSLADDAVISHRIAQREYRIRYAPDARVLVKYPSNYRDWIRQRVRSAGGYAQNYVRQSPYRMRSPRLELVKGTPRALRYARNAREFFWTLLLFGARLHLWLLVLIQVRLLRRSAQSLWRRVESTK